MPTTDLHFELGRWLQSPVGQQLEARLLAVLPNLSQAWPGINHLQVDLDKALPVKRNVRQMSYAELFSSSEYSPLPGGSLDSLTLMYSLDVAREPHRVLHMADQWLAGSGYLVIVGFNPYSLWGLLRWVMRWFQTTPWKAGFYSVHRIRDWLKVLNYDIHYHTSFGHTPPLERVYQSRLCRPYERFMSWLLPRMGAVNIIVAKRPLYPMTPTRQRLTHLEKPVAGAVAGPTRNWHDKKRHD